jgi:hypothetical protein
MTPAMAITSMLTDRVRVIKCDRSHPWVASAIRFSAGVCVRRSGGARRYGSGGFLSVSSSALLVVAALGGDDVDGVLPDPAQKRFQ